MPDSKTLTRARTEPRVLFIQSGGAAAAGRAMRALEQVVPFAQVTYVSHRGAHRPLEVAALPEARRLEVGMAPTSLARTAVALRRAGYARTVVLLSAELGYRRLKLLALAVTLRRLLIANENGDYYSPTPAALARHLLWRLRDGRFLEPWGRRAAATLRVIQSEGLAAALEKWRERLVTQHPSRLERRWRSPRLARLSFPEPPPSPLLSVVIVAGDPVAQTFASLLSLRSGSQTDDYEVVVVDRAVNDATGKLERHLKNVRWLRVHSGLAEPAARWEAVGACRAQAILFLTPGCHLAAGALAKLRESLAADPDCGAVGPMLLDPKGKLLQAGGVVGEDGAIWLCGRHDDRDKPDYNYRRCVDYLPCDVLLARRAALSATGGSTDDAAPWADVHFCAAVRARGYHLLYQPAARAFCVEPRFPDHLPLGALVLQRKSGERHSVPETEAREARAGATSELLLPRFELSTGATILVVDHYVPTPDRDAGSRFVYSLLEALRALGHRVIFWPDNLYRRPGYTEALQQLGVRVVYGPTDFEEFLTSIADFLDVAMIYRYEMASKYLGSVRAATRARTVFMICDLVHLREGRRVRLEGSAREGARVASIEREEMDLIRQADRVTVHSPVERDLIDATTPAAAVEVLPLPVAAVEPLGEDRLERRAGVLFIGSSHPPNLDALRFTIESIMPRVRRVRSDLTLTVVGEVGNRLDPALRRDWVAIEGIVPDIREYYESARLSLAPLRYGAGLKGKVLEAMSYGLPLVTTPTGAEGIGITAGAQALLGETAEELAESVIRLSRDDELWRSLRRAGRELIDQRYRPEAFRRQVAELMTELLEPPARTRRPSD